MKTLGAPQMKLQIAMFTILLSVALIAANAHPTAPNVTAPADFETRCGWFTNPTPANVWLYDREGEWTIGVQGGYQVEGDWPWPEFKPGQWVKTNAGSYGYGCACLQLRVNKETHEVIEIKTARGRTLAQCRQDASLKKRERSFR
jgi:Protein of unknown function (DUF4087)